MEAITDMNDFQAKCDKLNQISDSHQEFIYIAISDKSKETVFVHGSNKGKDYVKQNSSFLTGFLQFCYNAKPNEDDTTSPASEKRNYIKIVQKKVEENIKEARKKWKESVNAKSPQTKTVAASIKKKLQIKIAEPRKRRVKQKVANSQQNDTVAASFLAQHQEDNCQQNGTVAASFLAQHQEDNCQQNGTVADSAKEPCPIVKIEKVDIMIDENGECNIQQSFDTDTADLGGVLPDMDAMSSVPNQTEFGMEEAMYLKTEDTEIIDEMENIVSTTEKYDGAVGNNPHDEDWNDSVDDKSDDSVDDDEDEDSNAGEDGEFLPDWNDIDEDDYDEFLLEKEKTDTPEVGNDSKRTVQCSFCPRVFKNITGLKSHSRTHAEGYIKPMYKILGYDKSLLNPNKKRQTKSHQCDTCGKKFCSKGRLEWHVRNNAHSPHLCNVCGKKFKDRHTYKEHLRTTHKKTPHQCELCGKTFTRKKQMEIHHNSIHRGLHNYECTLCGEKFKYYNTYKFHKKKHLNQLSRSVCDVCGKDFSTKNNLTRHMRIHDKDTRYTCTFCPKTFVQKHGLTRHLRLHTGDKPYKCPICNEGFAHNVSLKNHKQKRHNLEEVTDSPPSLEQKSDRLEEETDTSHLVDMDTLFQNTSGQSQQD